MAVRIIPTSTTAPLYTQRTELDGRECVVAFDWNERDGAWYLAISDVDEERLLSGIKIVEGAPLLRRQTDPRLPPGEIVAVDTMDEGKDPGFADRGDRVILYYVDAADL